MNDDPVKQVDQSNRDNDEEKAIRIAMSIMGKRRAAKLSPEERQAISAQGGTAAWANITAEERSRMLSHARRLGIARGVGGHRQKTSLSAQDQAELAQRLRQQGMSVAQFYRECARRYLETQRQADAPCDG